ncbi:MAG: DNA polymerase III subunit alpha [Planctomycetota bacterium]
MAAQLSVATPWSFHWGASRVAELATAAAERGVAALGMADLNGLWGAVPFQRACESKGVKPVFGLRLRVEGVEAQLLAMNSDGWAALCRLSTKVQLTLSPVRGAAMVFVEHVGLGIPRLLLQWLLEERERVASGSFAILSRHGDLLRALQAQSGDEDLYVAQQSGARAQRDADLASTLQLPTLACPAVVFASPEDFTRHRLLVAIGRNTNLSRLPAAALACADPSIRGSRAREVPAWLRNELELGMDYRYYPESLQRARELAERADYRIPLGVKRMPRLRLKSDIGGDPHADPVAHQAAAWAELERACRAGITCRGLAWNEAYAQQLQRELQLIREQDLSDYFLIVADIVSWAQQQGIQNCGRGSAANSLVSYLLGFTHVDPLQHDLWFDRFLNRGRPDFPDVDLDFAWDERDRVLDRMVRRHGNDHVAMLSTHVTFGARGAIRELAKAMGVPPVEITPITRALPWSRGGLDLDRLRSHPKSAQLPLQEEPWRTILQQAVAIDGFPRHLGVHAGGMVLAPTALTDHLPLQRARKQTEDGHLVITQWDMGPVEDAGLLKIDLLGNRGLAVVRDAQKMVRRNSGIKLGFGRLNPKTDLRTQEMIAAGDTMGCFYIESPSMRSLLRKLRCREFTTLVAASSIIRPGISSSGMMQAYIERHHAVRTTGKHQADWYLHPLLRELFSETYGVMAYQEDVLRVAQRLAGMTAADADGLRKAMTKKGAHKRLPEWRSTFMCGVQKAGLTVEVAAELWRQIESFAGYSFCKAHSASYAEVSYRSAYLRAHHPAEFMASVLRNHGGFYASFAYVAEALRMGLTVERPCVNRGGGHFFGRARSLRTGLYEIQGLRRALVPQLLEEREHGGPYIGMQDFVSRLTPTREQLELLVRAGAMDGLPDGFTRPERMRWTALYKSSRTASAVREARLFADPGVPAPPTAAEFSIRRLLEMEEETLGYLVSRHPLSLHQEAIRAVDVVPARDLAKYAGRRVRLVGWQVTQKPVRTKSGESMSFLSFEDTTALYETVLFPQAYKRLAPWTLTRGPYVIEGIARDEFGSITVEVDHLQLLRDVAALDSHFRSPQVTS